MKKNLQILQEVWTEKGEQGNCADFYGNYLRLSLGIAFLCSLPLPWLTLPIKHFMRHVKYVMKK